MSTPYYNTSLSYEENYQQGPFGDFAKVERPLTETSVKGTFLGCEVNTPFGIPAGPLLNSKYTTAAFYHGFDICVYKTVRTVEHKSHPLPNVLSIHPTGTLENNLSQVLADNDFPADVRQLSITNSFGVPSFSTAIWQEDMATAVSKAGRGQILVGSFQGTNGTGRSIEEDYALAARLVAETKAPILEANLSCPNEGAHQLLCFDTDKVERIAHQIKTAVPDLPLIIKMAYFTDEAHLSDFIARVGKLVDGISVINTLSAKPVTKEGKPALGEARPEGGVCGSAIRWAGLDMVQRVANLRRQFDLKFAIVGVGGITSADDFNQYIKAGADAAMSATGSMWNPQLAIEIKQSLK